MISEKNAPRLVGAAFLFVAFASLISGILLTSVIGSGSLSDILVNVSQQLTLMRISILSQMVTSRIVVLAGLLYIVLHTEQDHRACCPGMVVGRSHISCSKPDRGFGTSACKPGFRSSGSAATFLLSNVG